MQYTIRDYQSLQEIYQAVWVLKTDWRSVRNAELQVMVLYMLNANIFILCIRIDINNGLTLTPVEKLQLLKLFRHGSNFILFYFFCLFFHFYYGRVWPHVDVVSILISWPVDWRESHLFFAIQTKTPYIVNMPYHHHSHSSSVVNMPPTYYYEHTFEQTINEF